MERFLIAMDCTAGSLRSIHYLTRILNGASDVFLVLYHALPTASPDKLTRREVQRIEQLHSEMPHLSGFFWKREDEECMFATFDQAKTILRTAGFKDAQYEIRFGVQSDDLASLLLDQACAFECSTMIVSRPRLSRVKAILWGSVTSAVAKLAKGMTVWIVDT